MLEAVLNELSFRKGPQFTDPVADDEHVARRLMGSFVICLSEGFRNKRISALRTDEDFAQQLLAPGYYLPQWRNDPAVNRDLRTLFRSFLTASPYFEEPTREIFVDGVRAIGLSSCFVTDSVSVSWDSEDGWRTALISAELATLVGEGDLAYRTVKIRNVANVGHWEDHSEWVLEKHRAEVTNGLKLLEYGSIVFPHLIFGTAARKQIAQLNGSEAHFEWILEALVSANSEVAVWEGGIFPHAKLPGPASGESESVNNSPRLRAMRVFEMNNGLNEYCEHHMKCRGANQRIHYVFDGAAKKMRIGYIGKHLETSKY